MCLLGLEEENGPHTQTPYVFLLLFRLLELGSKRKENDQLPLLKLTFSPSVSFARIQIPGYYTYMLIDYKGTKNAGFLRVTV